ncbi:hypothetical protein Nocox_40420 [Nonomuraea coxensis DSM 45129]|uniref:Uncharacterized protein n=1 Tax=Nonomuraea coxensis DSM 45129 TaxID=1122611 RepID=A0ABX8UH72_9ACTN|nr:hypothetical protein [Nonomuraea coxensis]QYC45627.1 hypothetical protein Nocox_40420 [Nonomuraea coxensis DSM 45129]
MDYAAGRPTVILDNGVVGRVMLAHPSRRDLVLVLGMSGTLLSVQLDDIACVVGGEPLCHEA